MCFCDPSSTQELLLVGISHARNLPLLYSIYLEDSLLKINTGGMVERCSFRIC